MNKKKYFPNNWKAYSQSPDSFFIPLTYDEFERWKINGWMLPSSVDCIIREEDIKLVLSLRRCIVVTRLQLNI